jgi:hypothetical protein
MVYGNIVPTEFWMEAMAVPVEPSWVQSCWVEVLDGAYRSFPGIATCSTRGFAVRQWGQRGSVTA